MHPPRLRHAHDTWSLDEHYELIGEAYVAGIMNEKAMIALREGRRTLQEFEIH